MRVLICGDRDWWDAGAINYYVSTLPKDTVVIHGGYRGADTFAGRFAKSIGLEVEVYMAEWTKYGKKAGPLRNQRMLDEGNPDLVVYFHNDMKNSTGTVDMVLRAEKEGIPVIDGTGMCCETYKEHGVCVHSV